MKVGFTKQEGVRWVTRRVMMVAALLISGTSIMAADDAGSAAPFVAKLETSTQSLSGLRETIAAEKIPLADALGKAEVALSSAKQDNEEARRRLDKLALDVSTVRANVAVREQEKTYIGSLLGEYARNLETRLHIAELEKYGPALEAARLALENDALADTDKFAKQFEVLALSIERVENLLGGVVFEGRAAGLDGIVKPGKYVFLGPVAYFRSGDGTVAGVAEQKLGSVEPSVVKYSDFKFETMTGQLVANGYGDAPVDGSLGNAQKMAETQETFSEHVRRGGPVMWPICILAVGVALVIVLKFIQLSLVAVPSARVLEKLYEAIRKGENERAREIAAGMRGMIGKMLVAGMAHLKDSKELIEESMYEKMLVVRFRLTRFIPIIAIVASIEPLLGLLGTVTGIINTFQMLTVFGSGDIKQLSGGIAEALITTEGGLVVAIPALLCHSFLSRKAKGILDKLEHIVISVMSEVERSRSEKE